MRPEEYPGAGDPDVEGRDIGSLRITTFVDRYGPELFWGWNRITTNPDWETRDGVIPYRLFRVLSDDMDHLWALDTLSTSQGVGLAIDLAFEESKVEARRKVNEILDEALPDRS